MRLLPLDYAVRNLSRSPTRLLLGLAGATFVVLLALAAAAFVRGMNQSLTLGGGPDNVLLLSAGSEESVERGEIPAATPEIVGAAIPGIRTLLGQAFISPEVHMQTTVTADAQASEHPQVMVRGITPAAFLVHERARLVEGRLPVPGADELVAGSLVARRLGLPQARVAIGQTLWLHDRDWTIVGRLDAAGSGMSAELWMPLADLQVAAQRDSLSCVVLTLDGRSEFDDVDAFAKQRLDLELVALRESDYHRALAGFFAPIRAMVWATALLIGSGGILGGLNTMYAAFAHRVREVGALQSMGFSRRAIVVSLLQESLLLSAAGTLLASAIAVLLLDGVAVPFSSGAFGLRVDAAVLGVGLAAGGLLGLLGALPPAVRCLRLPIPEALKAS